MHGFHCMVLPLLAWSLKVFLFQLLFLLARRCFIARMAYEGISIQSLVSATMSCFCAWSCFPYHDHVSIQDLVSATMRVFLVRLFFQLQWRCFHSEASFFYHTNVPVHGLASLTMNVLLFRIFFVLPWERSCSWSCFSYHEGVRMITRQLLTQMFFFRKHTINLSG